MANDAIKLGELRLFPFRELLAGSEPLKIGPKALELLSVLADARGALVTKLELMEAVWPDVIVEEGTLHVHIAALRKAMGAEGARISSVRSLGYRLRIEAADGENAPADGATSDTAFPILAVLAFEAEPEDADGRLFADGLSEDVLQAVCRIDAVRVIARSSSFQLRGPDKAPHRVAKEVGATHILDGVVRSQGDSARVNAELVEVASQTVLWTDRFACDVGAVANLCEDIAEAIATTLGAHFVRREQRPANAQAMAMYLKARALIGPKETNGTSIALLEAAVACDPELAPAWSLLAYAQAVALRWHERRAPVDILAAKIRDAAQTGLRLDPSSGIAYLALGLLDPLGDYASNDRHLARAMALAPNDVAVLNRQAVFDFAVGRIRKAFPAAAKANLIDPLNINVCVNYADLLAEIGLATESEEVALAGNQRWPGTWWMIGVPLIRAASCGDWQAVDSLMPVAEASPADGFDMVRFTVSALRDPGEANRAKVRDLCERQLQRRSQVQPSSLVFAYNMWLRDEAFDWVARSDYLNLFRVDGHPPESRGFSPGVLFSVANVRMRQDPRFPSLCAKLGLCAYWLEGGDWPDCAGDHLGYDFKAECARSAGFAS